jgi:hypothetical protein
MASVSALRRHETDENERQTGTDIHDNGLHGGDGDDRSRGCIRLLADRHIAGVAEMNNDEKERDAAMARADAGSRAENEARAAAFAQIGRYDWSDYDLFDYIWNASRKHRDAEIASQERTVWLVCFGNYYPREINSIWATKELAQQQAESLGSGWDVEEWEVEQLREGTK